MWNDGSVGGCVDRYKCMGVSRGVNTSNFSQRMD